MEFKLPEIGEGVVEGELIRWLVKEGDTVTLDQPLLEVMTDKATVEIPSPGAGVISALKGTEGQMLKVGGTLAQISETSAAAKAAPALPSTPTKAPEASKSESVAPAKAESVVKTPVIEAKSESRPYVGALEALGPSSVPAAPLVRVMAQKAGVRLEDVPASGPEISGQKRVLEADLLRYLDNGSSTASSSSAVAPPKSIPAPAKTFKPMESPKFVATGSQEVERRPLRGLRRVISQAMVRSKFTAPHYAYVDEFECSKLVELREEAKKYGESYGVKITYLPFIVKATVAALKEFPIVNSSLEEKEDGSADIVLKKFYNIGFAVATDEGLLVPVIKNADQKSLLQIAKEMQELSAKVRAGKASPDELKGSTFSITSMGNVGGLFATPIINYPEVGIMGVYRVQEKPIVKNGQIVVGKTMHLSLSLDHRVVDGAVGGHFCNAIIDRLANPSKLLLELM